MRLLVRDKEKVDLAGETRDPFSLEETEDDPDDLKEETAQRYELVIT
jgi:hypothetical protein